MATTNRDRIGQMLDLLGPALDAFITRVLAPELAEGANWTSLVAARDLKKDITGKEYERSDVQVQLRMLTENIPHQVKPGWYPFDGQLSRVQQSYASELRDVRNDWAHSKAFTDDDAYRALDTAERLLTGIGEAGVAGRIAGIRRDLRRVTADKDDKRTLKAATAVADSAGLRPWREVLRPHDDVATGNFHSAEFAADLFTVSSDTAERGATDADYTDPTRFFARTYLTDGLKDLVSRAVRRLSGDENASPVINLQTNFGGGKTHSMLALWHLAGGVPLDDLPQEIQLLLEPLGYSDLGAIKRVAVVGNHFAPTGVTKDDGTVVRTIWGELAWQLGGADGYAMVAEADAAGTSPALHALLAAHAPAVILIDEWVAYARQLPDTPEQAAGLITGGTFDTQFTFAQALTEAVKATPGVLLAVSIPASNDPSGEDVAGVAEEVGGPRGMEALNRLQNVVRRVADQWRPASSTEAYEIVRRRLFVEPDAAAIAAIRSTARGFVDYYRKYSDDFPREVREADYEDRIRRTYPIHPELFDRLYEDWSALEKFQRTRGVLRLMNTVIYALWTGDDAAPLIMPGSVPLSVAAVNSELTQYLPDSWKAVIDADVDGEASEPAKIDQEKPVLQQRSVTRRLARTVFFGAAPTVGSNQKGLELRRVFLGTATPGDLPGNFHTALNTLGDRATYFYFGSGKYWYDLVPNITRRAKDQAERLHKEDVWAEIARRLSNQAGHRGDFVAVHVCPEGHADIPDVDEARLVVLHPRLTHQRTKTDSPAMTFAREATDQRGSARRGFRNMLVYLAPDAARMDELDVAVRDFLAWSQVLEAAPELGLTHHQTTQAQNKRDAADATSRARLLGAYHWALVPGGGTELGAPFVVTEQKAEGQSDWLAERVSRKLAAEGTLAVQQAAPMVRHWLERLPSLWSAGHVSLGDLWQQYATYPYMPRLRDRSVLVNGLTDYPTTLGWESEGFALASGFDGERYESLWLPGDDGTFGAVTDATLLVRPAPAAAQRRKDLAATRPDDDESDGSTTSDTGGTSGSTHGATDGPPRYDYYFGAKDLDAALYAIDFKKISEEVLTHLAGAPGVTLRVRIEIEAEAAEGFTDFQLRTVRENAATLKFEQNGFEQNHGS